MVSPLSMTIIRPLLAGLLLLWAGAASARQEVLTLTAEDGAQLAAVLTTPDRGYNPAAPVFVHVHGGIGGSAVIGGRPPRDLAAGLAAFGYASLAAETRHAASYPFTPFDAVIPDVKAAIDAVAARGAETIILTGYDLGALRAVRYLVETADPRIAALALYSPNLDLPQWRRENIGEERYWALVETAAEAINTADRAALIDLGDGLVWTSAMFLDWWGPTAQTSLTVNITGVDVPIFLAASTDDPLVPEGRLETLASSAVISPRVEFQYYEDAGHTLSGATEDVVSDTAEFAARLGLRPRPAVVTRTLDVTADTGQTLTGVLYEPEGGVAPGSPVMMVMHGLNGDILRSSAHWLAADLAERGYAALAFQHRQSGLRPMIGGVLQDLPADFKVWVDAMEQAGYGRIIGVGHSAGNLWWSYYVTETQDDRIDGLVYLSPMRDMPAHARAGMGEDAYARVVLEAQDAVRAGAGKTQLIGTTFPQPRYEPDERMPMFLPLPGAGFTFSYAEAFLSYWGPASEAVHSQLIAQVEQPILAVGGSRDPFMQGAWLIEFTEAAGGPATYRFYDGPSGATLAFNGYEDRVADDIVNWLAAAF